MARTKPVGACVPGRDGAMQWRTSSRWVRPRMPALHCSRPSPRGDGTLDLGAVNQGGATITAVGSLTGNADVLDITLGTAAGANTTGGTVNTTNFETVNITSLGGASAMTGLAMAPVAGTTVNVLGNFGADLGNVAASNIDASGLTLAGATAAGLTVTATTAAKITGSGGVDNITGSAQADVIMGGAGADQIRVVADGGTVAHQTAVTLITSAADSFVTTVAALSTTADTVFIEDVAAVAANNYTMSQHLKN